MSFSIIITPDIEKPKDFTHVIGERLFQKTSYNAHGNILRLIVDHKYRTFNSFVLHVVLVCSVVCGESAPQLALGAYLRKS